MKTEDINKKQSKALKKFKKKYPMISSSDMQTFILGWQACVDAKKTPSENDIVNTIINCVDIKGIEIEHYRREFTNERCGLSNRLIELFEK